MSQPVPPASTCTKCGAPLDPENHGSCPHCLMLAAMKATEGSIGGTPEPAPPIAEVAAAFPQLEILELIGQGGMGCVFKARQPRLNRLVALKLLPASLTERDPSFAGRFEREGQLLARLHHPNIVAVHDSGTAGDFFYLIMEYVDGVNLRQAMRNRRFTAREALAIVPLICDALQFAHDEGVLHRDIKPENILLDAKGRVKLADFGIAKLVAEADLGSSGAATAGAGLTQSGAALGTPSYMAPEQRETPHDIDNRADIYSLGVVFYELLTGDLPRERFTPPSSRGESDPRIDPIVRQALEVDRDRRQRSAGEVRTQVTSLGTPEASAVRKPAKMALALASLLLLIAIAAPLTVMSRLDRANQERAAQHLAQIKEQQQKLTSLSIRLGDMNASAGRAASRAGNSSFPEEVRREASEEQQHFEQRAGKAQNEIAMVHARLSDLNKIQGGPSGGSWLILLSFVPFATAGLVLLVRNGYGKGAALVAGTLLVLTSAYVVLRVSRSVSRHGDSGQPQLAARRGFPKYESVSKNGAATVYFAHDDIELHYALFHAGKFTASTSGSRNRNGVIWRDDSGIKLANGQSFGITRNSVDPLSVTINGTEYDLRRGRLFVLGEGGAVIQHDTHPSIENARSIEYLKTLVEREGAMQSSRQSTNIEPTPPRLVEFETWSYTPRYLTPEKIEQRRHSPEGEDDGWTRDISLEHSNGVMKAAGPRERVRRAATLLRVLDYPEPKSIAELRGLNDGPDIFTSSALPILMKRSDFANSPLTDELVRTLEASGITASQLGRALSAHVLELEKAEFVNRGVPFEQITRSPGASTWYEGKIPCADRPDQPLTLCIERTTQQMGTQSKFDRFAPWLLEEAKNLPAEQK